jgi:hypothetical protein
MGKSSEEIRVRASTGGRPITLEPLNEITDLVVPARRVESTIPCGFQQVFGEGSIGFADGEVSFTLTSGAGWGNAWMTLSVERDGATYALECLDVNDLAKAWLARVERDGPTPRHVPLVVPREGAVSAGACVCGWVSEDLGSADLAHAATHEHVETKLAEARTEG